MTLRLRPQPRRTRRATWVERGRLRAIGAALGDFWGIDTAREFTGHWTGQVQPGFEDEHQRFVDALRTPESANLLRKCSLTDYAIYQYGLDLEIIFKSEKPVIIAGFLRNKRLWPRYWEFHQPGSTEPPADKPLLFRWTRE